MSKRSFLIYIYKTREQFTESTIKRLDDVTDEFAFGYMKALEENLDNVNVCLEVL